MKYHDGKDRCSWANPKNPIYIDYHDKEWGVPVYDDHKLFEMLILESFQAGLSWECVLNKREAFREAFDDFDVYKVSAYDEEKQAQLKENKGIIRNQRKISAAVSNATIFMKIQEQYGTFSEYLWKFTDHKIIHETGKRSFIPICRQWEWSRHMRKVVSCIIKNKNLQVRNTAYLNFYTKRSKVEITR